MNEGTETRRSQVSMRVDSLEKNITTLQESLAKLETRLEQVLRPEITRDSVAVVKDKEPDAIVPLASELERLNIQLVGLTSKVNNMWERTEL